MKPERWRQVEQIYHGALELEEGRRSAFLAEACAGDEALRREIDSLLGFDQRAEGFIESPAMEVAAKFFAPADEGLEGVEQQEAQAPVERIGAYRIIGEVGRGGMGTVYLAERDDDEYHNQVAIKLIKRGMDTDAILHRFRTERQILARLNHPNIARLLDGGTTSDGRPYFVMEFIEGRPIDHYVDELKLSITERLNLFLQVCLAIQYSHQHLVVHRDIKPSNIIVTPDGTAKLLDFGVAKLVTPDTGVAETRSTTGWMTPEYSSPEQLRGEPATTTSDVYSLGVVLYELLTGRRPYRFEARSPDHMVEMILNNDPDRPSTAAIRREPATVREDATTWLSVDVISESRGETPDKLRRRLSGDLDNIVLKAMHREKSLRYRSATELAQDIRRHLDGYPVLARKDSLSYKAGKFIGRNRVGVAAAALLILTLTGGIIATAWQARVARRAQATSERRFQDVRKLARSVVFDYHDAISNLPGSTPVREKLVRDALEYLNSLAEDAGQDASLKAEIADAYEKISSIQGGRGVANLGDSAGAVESLRKCQQIRQSLLDQNPHDPALRMKVADAYRSLARLLGERGGEEALESYRKAVEISEGLISIDPTNSDYKYQAATNYAALADFLVDLGDWRVAVDTEQKALDLFQAIPSDDPQIGDARRSMAASYQVLSTALKQLDDPAGSEVNAAKSLEILMQLSRENPTDSSLRRRVGVSHFFLGEALDAQKRDKEALDSFRQYAAIAEELSAADPRNTSVFLDRSIAYSRIGASLKKTGQIREAVSYFRRSLDICRSVYNADPDNLYKRNTVISRMSWLTGTYTEAGDISAAVAEGRMLSEMLTAADDNSELAYLRGASAVAHKNIALAFEAASARSSSPEERKRLREQAHAQYHKCLDILLDMQSKGTLFPSDVPVIEEARQGVARCNSPIR